MRKVFACLINMSVVFADPGDAILTPYTPYFIEVPGREKKMTVLNVLPIGVEGTPEIPKDCLVWTNGCNDCQVKDGKVVECTKKHCEFSKCLPFCKKYDTIAKPPENCLSWYDGCNRCRFLSKEVLYQSTATGQTFGLRPKANANLAMCTRMFCYEKKDQKCFSS